MPTTTRHPSAPARSQASVKIINNRMVRLGLKNHYATSTPIPFVLAAPSVDEFIANLVGRENAELVLLDLLLGDGSPPELGRPSAPTGCAGVLDHRIADRVASVREALAAGAAGVIPKSSATKAVIAAIAVVARGEVLNNPGVGRWPSSTPTAGGRGPASACRSGDPAPVRVRLAARACGRAAGDRLLPGARVPRPHPGQVCGGGRPAPTKVDLLRRAVEDGILPGLDPDGGLATGSTAWKRPAGGRPIQRSHTSRSAARRSKLSSRGPSPLRADLRCPDRSGGVRSSAGVA